MIVNRRLLLCLEKGKRKEKEKDMKIIMNVDTINSQIVYYSFFRYGLIFSFILVDLNCMFICHLRKLWTKLIPELFTKRGKQNSMCLLCCLSDELCHVTKMSLFPRFFSGSTSHFSFSFLFTQDLHHILWGVEAVH